MRVISSVVFALESGLVLMEVEVEHNFYFLRVLVHVLVVGVAEIVEVMQWALFHASALHSCFICEHKQMVFVAALTVIWTIPTISAHGVTFGTVAIADIRACISRLELLVIQIPIISVLRHISEAAPRNARGDRADEEVEQSVIMAEMVDQIIEEDRASEL